MGSKLAEDALLVGFSSQRGGVGTWLIAPMSPTDAAEYEVDSTVTLHYRKPTMIGWGDLVAIMHCRASHSERGAA
ncbi:hypothetical protein [Paraburkholderia fungorum]|uniref:hypothetical protein n=1 Tax=Paraburkholderia fungorum TaxID=134537 RepID=UPI001609B378|nr:hypothetical protein [Paraburkholderia fungorum]MBB5546513.1 hypothetical protein [Paraburkholderia fungorum]